MSSYAAAGGTYFDNLENSQAFVADEVGGTWGKAIEVPGNCAPVTGGNDLRQ